MTQTEKPHEQFWEDFHGQNQGYIEEQYELYQQDPSSVEPTIKSMFDQYGAPDWLLGTGEKHAETSAAPSKEDIKKLTSAMKLVEAIRRFGHLEADIYPVGEQNRSSDLIQAESYDLTDDDLQSIPANWLWEEAPANFDNGLDVVEYLKKCYAGTITFESDHVNSEQERQWLLERIEKGTHRFHLSNDQQKELLDRLIQVDGFENFLQKTFVGQKRFSIEGLDSMVPMLDQLVKYSAQDKVEHIMLGMAHRGRLSVLAHVLGKPIEKIFSEFQLSPDKELVPSEGSTGINYGWTGDVKYHYGAVKDVTNTDQSTMRITMANNPSHLEFVNPVIEGFARAGQDDRSEKGAPEQDFNKAFPVLIHGDASFIGEGVVAETLNLSNLPGYDTGGTVHVIANNLLGYTTTQNEGRSTRYASDLAKGFEIPIIHVNADDPVACVNAVKIAYDYRQAFHKDFLIDLVGYRRYGHNEIDEPRTTQPQLYQNIDEHPSTANVYAASLEADGIINQDEVKEMKERVHTQLRNVYEGMREANTSEVTGPAMPEALTNGLKQHDTSYPIEKLRQLNQELLKWPDDFKPLRKLEKILKRRETMLDEGNKADWGAGEALTYASILSDGISIRLTGQDTERGTFAHRHMMLHDVNTGATYSPLQDLAEADASFDIRNSPLSEAGVLAFEYGYSVQASDTLVIWEAQFGDFANAGQVIFDQFISSARAKWGDISNMVMLLPHAYEGQGPEHSSARLERFLQMAAENNWIVANVTSTAQFFHLMRRQAAMRGREEARPLVIMTPKSLLRNQRVASSAEAFAEGHFMPLRNQPSLKVSKKNASRLLIGSGKVMVDIEEAIDESEESFDWLRALRLEQIYPFPNKELEQEIKALPNLEEIVWVQEEPKNMGSWDFVDDYLRELLQPNQTLRYVGRPDRSSPAVGEPNVHKVEQEQIIQEAINPSKGGHSSARN